MSDRTEYNYEEFLNTYIQLWDEYKCPMNGVDRAQVRLLFKQEEYEEALKIIDRHHEIMVKAGRIPKLRKIMVDVRLPLRCRLEESKIAVSEEWLDESEQCEHWDHDEQVKDWNEYAGDGFEKRRKLKNGW